MKKIFTLVFLAICGAAQAQTGFAREIITDETSGDFHLMYTAIADIDGDGKNDVVSKGSTKSYGIKILMDMVHLAGVKLYLQVSQCADLLQVILMVTETRTLFSIDIVNKVSQHT
ncbi:hypothetical protein LRS05_00230 [Flavobacterium sp. J372]|uniref:hypothetical protein n=1 Tax=Flavobacterium sp. J372 TaxID=2898436 RepID=UPI00215133DF|nr:hypothetical protein [Flavobacterium sp. J372]MCR5860681.1 hypothetical protein [Flavobacterium sp. J372]